MASLVKVDDLAQRLRLGFHEPRAEWAIARKLPPEEANDAFAQY